MQCAKKTSHATVPLSIMQADLRQTLYLLIFQKNVGNFFDFLLSKLFYKEKVNKFQQIYGKL